MEKKNVKLGGGFDLSRLMLMGNIKPDCSVCSVIGIKGSRLSVKLESAVESPVNIRVGFYDEALSGCFAVCDGYAVSRDEIAFNFEERFAASLANTGKQYYRMCIAIEYEKQYSCFYIQSRNYVPVSGGDDYRGSLCVSAQSGKTLAAYFSKGGRLSAKLVDSKAFYNEFYGVEIYALTKTESAIEIEAACKSTDIQLVELYCVSFDGRTTLPLELANRKGNVLTAELRFETLSGLDFTKYILKAKVNGVSVDTKWNSALEIKGCSLYEPITFEVDGQTGCISCADAKTTFEFDLIEKYYSAVFSVIIAVYNTELFIAEAIESVLAQNTAPIAMAIAEDKTTVYGSLYELILVDDGSTDSSGEICDRYAARYPQIKVIHKENGGVSSARNLGIENAGGKYLNFLDSDDKFSDNVLSECFAFFEKHYDETNIITFPIKFFDAAEGDHWQNYKFSDGSRIIDHVEERDKTLQFVNASIFKGDVVRTGFRFDEGLRTGEDVKFIYSIIFGTIAKIGVLNTCTYWYRRRQSGEESAIQMVKSTREFYFDKLTNLSNWLIETSEKYYGEIPYYVQYTIAQDLQWRILQDGDGAIAKSIISEEEYEEYKQNLIRLLQYVDTEIILEQKKIWREQKMFMVRLKYQCEPQKYFMNNDIAYCFDGRIVSVASTCYWKIDFLKIENGHLYIDGFNMSFEKDQEIFICVNGEFIGLLKTTRDKSILSLGEEIFYGFAFNFDYPLDSSVSQYNVGFFERIDGHYIQKKDIRFGKFSPIGKKYKKSYFMSEQWIARMEDSFLKIKNISSSANSIVELLAGALDYEKEFIDEIQNGKDGSMPKVREAVELRKKIFPLKSFYNRIAHKQIWLISDRLNMAGDNGEAFFLYLQQIDDPDIDVYFVIGDECEDYERMCQYGKVLVQNSSEYKMVHLLADYLISAQALEYIFNPFSNDNTSDIFRDMLSTQKFIFLQHGITKDDISGWVNKYNKNMSGFITAALPEYRSILEYDYFYTENEVWLTGFPRHDRLYDDPKHYITVMPTWRKYLSEDVAEGITTVSGNFKESEYFDFYNRLLNDKRLLAAAKENGYTICFRPHPYIMDSLQEFDRSPDVVFFEKDKPYREVYAESDLVMTDYSSSVMDFAYLRKPIVYCQFDRDEFFSGKHTYVEGYYDYETDGFGELVFTLEDVVELLIEYMRNGCALKPVYKERMDKFFAFNDKNNCERVYKKIKEM